MPLAMSTDCGCNSKSLQDGWELPRWLAPTNSNDFGCTCISPSDGWKMAGWLVLSIPNDFGCYFGSLGHDWGIAARTHLVLEQQYRQMTIGTTNNPYSTNKNQNQMAGWLAVAISKNLLDANLNRRKIAGRWLGGCPWPFPQIAGVILDRCKMAGS